MAKKRLFKDHPDGIQLHAGSWRGDPVWHSDDGGKTWWSGFLFGSPGLTTEELKDMTVSILQGLPTVKK